MLNVLIVDDEPEILEIMEELVKDELECNVVKAGNGMEAFQKTEGEKFDLICTDFKMPVMDGGGLIQAVRTKPNLCKETPIIVLTGYRDEAESNVQDAEGVFFLDKPIRTEKFIRTAKLAIGTKAAA